MRKILTGLLLATLVGCGVPQKDAKDLGSRAQRAGVDPRANPYQGISHHSEESAAWLTGWLDAKEGR